MPSKTCLSPQRGPDFWRKTKPETKARRGGPRRRADHDLRLPFVLELLPVRKEVHGIVGGDASVAPGFVGGWGLGVRSPAELLGRQGFRTQVEQMLHILVYTTP